MVVGAYFFIDVYHNSWLNFICKIMVPHLFYKIDFAYIRIEIIEHINTSI